MTKTRLARPTSRRAFSLIELLVVILIIALITAIVLPALGHARKAARKAASLNLMNQVSQACSSFQISERRLPGYFSEADMGSLENATRGFTEMENVMFDLAGGVVPTDGSHVAYYGPVAAHAVAYDRDLVGAVTNGNKVYFTPPRANFKYQDGVEGGTKVTSIAEQRDKVRDLVDAEGTPLLMWRTDAMAVQPVKKEADFAQLQSGAATGPARFYWNANSAFLSSTSCGTKRVDQTTTSLIGSGNATGSPQPNVSSLLGLLGNPSSPNNLTPPPGNSILPTAGRGAFIIQSAGTDATFIGKEERGAKQTPTGNSLPYDLNFPSGDVMANFDDIIVAGG